jgi:hypothetical protein
MRLEPGMRLAAGLDKPWIAPESLITGKLEEIGFRNVVWHEGQIGAPANRTQLNSGSWDHWITADYAGRSQEFTVPSQLKWYSLLGSAPAPVVPVAPPIQVQPPTPLEVVSKKLGLDPGQALGMLCLELAAEIALFSAIRGWFKRRRG